MRSKTFQILGRLDNFGYEVGLHYGALKKNHTWLGIFLSIMKKALIFTYFLHIFIVCVKKRDPAIQFSEIYRDFEEATEIYEASELGMDIAFSVVYSIQTENGSKYVNAESVGIDHTYFNISAV